MLFRISDRAVAHTLFVPALHDLDPAVVGVKGLPEAYRNPVPEQCEKCLYKFRLFSVHRNILLIQEFHDRLCSSQSDCFFHDSSSYRLNRCPHL